VSVETGIAPQALAELDAEMFAAVLGAAEKRWTPELELTASLLEVEHAALLAFARVHGRKGQKLPAALRVPRPGEEERPAPRARRVSIRELAQMSSPEIIAVEEPPDA
jgi:hypothetical protein